MIILENVTKVFPGSTTPAVDNLSLHVTEGETCVFVGPSGCGKTTTMKMINRLIVPTEGKIYVDNNDIMTADPIELRRNIGYVIQEIGLFPHMTIADNIATVPKEKKWSRTEIKNRVDELLELMGLDPDIYRNRYPRDLSGGQRQRVGVARAMAADPPVMLMDEPFGAVDPITRGRLQDEFLKMQEKIKKTIIFVTHDIDEAIKMGSRIAVLREGRLVQYDEPATLLSKPADEFVEDLVGGDSTLKRLNLILAEEVMAKPTLVAFAGENLADIRERCGEEPGFRIYVLDQKGCLLGYLPQVEYHREGRVDSFIQPVRNTIDGEMRLSDVLSEMLSGGDSSVCVLDQNKKLEGIVRLQNIIEGLGKE